MRARGGCWALSRAATRRSRPSGAASDSTSKVTRRCPAGASGSTAAGPRSRTASALGVSAATASSGSSEGEHRNGSAPVQARTSARTSSSRGPEESAAAIGPSDRGSVRPAPTGPAKPAAMMRTLTPGAGGAPSAVRLAQAAGGGSGPGARALIGGAAEAPRTAEGAGEAGTATPSVRAGYGGRRPRVLRVRQEGSTPHPIPPVPVGSAVAAGPVEPCNDFDMRSRAGAADRTVRREEPSGGAKQKGRSCSGLGKAGTLVTA